jgi:hypothetical protein
LDEFEAFVLGEVGIVLTLNVARGSLRTRQQAAIQESFAGRGRPRSWA